MSRKGGVGRVGRKEGSSLDLPASAGSLDQRAELFEISHVVPVRFDPVRRAALLLRGFQQHGQAGEASIVHEPTECLEADFSLSDMCVAVDPAAERLPRVVDMKQAESIEADQPAEGVERARVAFWRGDVVAGSKEMTCIETN